jgi:NADH-quinone oxidoreductase subunit J
MSIATLFYLTAAVAVLASIKVVTGKNTVHALLYLVVSLLAVAVCFYLMGAPFAAGLEVIVYAGAILVLFVFAIMMFGLTQDETQFAAQLYSQGRGIRVWIGPVVLALALLVELISVINNGEIQQQLSDKIVGAKQVGILLYGPYLLAVEIASFLLLAGLVAGYHYAKPDTQEKHL